MRISDWSSDVCSSDLQQRTFSRGQDDAAQIASPTGRRRVRCSHIEMIVRKETREHFRIAAIFVRSEEHTSELQSLMRISYAVFCLKKKNGNSLAHPPYI